MTATPAAAPAAKVSRGKGAKVVPVTPAAPQPAPKAYKIRKLNFPIAIAKQAGKMRDDKLSIAAIAAKLNLPINGDKSATQALICYDHGLTPDESLHGDLPALGKAIADMRADRDSWGKVSVRFNLTGSCARRLYEMHTGLDSSAIDLRKRNGDVVSYKVA